MPPAAKRSRNPIDDEPAGPSKVQLRGLSWNTAAAQPAFLKNALSALQGPKPARKLDDSGRPSLPERPDAAGGEDGVEPLSDEDEWDFGRGDEAPAVVVLKEGKHLDRNEVDKMRSDAKANSSADPLASSSAPTNTKATGSLSFNTTSKEDRAAKAKATLEPGENETWEQVLERSKLQGEMQQLAKEQQQKEQQKLKERKQKQQKKEKKENKNKVARLSFADE